MRGSRCAAACAVLLAGHFSLAVASAAEQSLEARALAALRPAAAAAATGNAGDAAARFDAAGAIAEIAGPARVLAARSWLDADDAAAAERAARAGLERDLGVPWEADLFAALASARRAQGDAVGARSAWREALARGVPPERAAEIRLAIAASFDASELDAIAVELRAAWIDGTPRPASDRAEAELGRREQQSGRALRSASDWSARADALFSAQRTEAALRAYESALQAGGAASLRAHVARRRAECLFRSRRYAEAVDAFGALGDDPEASVWRARSLARAGRVDAAIAELDAIAARAPRATAAWARYLAGLLHEGRGSNDAARTAFAKAAADGEGKVATDALWRLGFGAVRLRDHAAAQRHLDALAERQTDPLERLAPRYWAARSRPRPEDRSGELAAIAREFPFSYYGVRAAALAAVPPAPTPRRVDDAPPSLRERDLRVARVLIDANLVPSALRLIEWLEGQAANLRDRLAVARLFARAGQPHRAQATLMRRDAEQLARGPVPELDELWRLAWPDAFASERRAALAGAGDARTPTWLVAALMREESGYRPDAVSVTGALGLLQLMPDTAERVARRFAVAGFARERLLEPAFNLRLGTLHVEELSERFPGRSDAVAASYNAGAAAVEEWLRAAPADDAEWVESIPYEETRGYVKRVLRSLHVYQELYR